MSGRRTNALRAGGGLVAGERLERHGAGAPADAENCPAMSVPARP